MTIHLFHPQRTGRGSISGRAAGRPRPPYDIDPELVVALARQIPALETDGLVRLITSSTPGGRAWDDEPLDGRRGLRSTAAPIDLLAR